MTDGSALARAFCGFIAAYWGVRVPLQLFVYHGHSPKGMVYRLGEVALLVGFLLCTVIYTTVALGKM